MISIAFMRIATWNLERPNANEHAKIEGVLGRIKAVDADIWILTETNTCLSPGSEFQSHASLSMTAPEKYADGENRTTIASRLPILATIPTHDPETAVCVEVSWGNSRALVYGTILAYHAAGTRYTYRFQGHDVSGRESWELHYESIASHAEEWKHLRREYPTHHFILGGDLNQTRTGSLGYGTHHGRELLGNALAECDLVCATGGNILSLDDATEMPPVIDHICIDRGLARNQTAVRGWLAGAISAGKRLSDHSGTVVEIKEP